MDIVRSVLSTIFLFSLHISIAPSAVSQPIGSRIGRYQPAEISRTGRGEAARTTLEDLARCVVAREPGKVSKLTGLARGSEAGIKFISDLFHYDDDCLGSGEIRFKADLLRGYLFRSLYVRKYAKSAPTDFSAVKTDLTALYGTVTTQEEAVGYALQEFGECVVKAAPLSARQLTLSRAREAEEKQAFQDMLPILNTCLRHGNTVTFSRVFLKGVLAEALYRLTLAADAPQPSP